MTPGEVMFERIRIRLLCFHRGIIVRGARACESILPIGNWLVGDPRCTAGKGPETAPEIQIVEVILAQELPQPARSGRLFSTADVSNPPAELENHVDRAPLDALPL